MIQKVLLNFIFLNAVIVIKGLPQESHRHYHQRDQHQEYPSVPRKATTNDDIIFPDVAPRIIPDNDENESYSAVGKGLKCVENVCEDAREYPIKRIEKIISEISKYKGIFGHIEGAVIDTPSRTSEDEPSESLCAVLIHTKYPKTLSNVNKTEKFIVNVEGHKQGLMFETCVNKAKCMFGSLFPTNYVSECSQKYARRRLMALGSDGNPAFDTFIVPSCCVCTVKKIKN